MYRTVLKYRKIRAGGKGGQGGQGGQRPGKKSNRNNAYEYCISTLSGFTPLLRCGVAEPFELADELEQTRVSKLFTLSDLYVFI